MAQITKPIMLDETGLAIVQKLQDVADAIDGGAELKSRVTVIEGKIPSQASPANQLADKAFVNSSIATNTANYIFKTNALGEKLPFDSVAELEAYAGTVTNNDYAFVTGLDADGNVFFDRCKASVAGGVVTWAKEYRLNNSSFTAAQWAAINSGFTSGDKALLLSALSFIEACGDIVTHNASEFANAAQGAKADTALQSSDIVDDLESAASDKPISARAVNVDMVEYVDASISDTMAYIDQQDNSEHAGRVAGDNLLDNKKANKDGYYTTLSAGYADKAGNLEPWASRDENPVENESRDRVRTTGGDESIDGKPGAVLISFVCRGADYTPTRIISSGINLLRLQSNNGLALALGAGWYFPVPKLTATNESIGTANENNGVLFLDSEGNNLTPTVRFKTLADGVPTSLDDGDICTYLDKNGRRHYTTPGAGYLIVSGITHAITCARIAWSTDYDKFVSPASELDAGTIKSLAGIGTLRSVGLGGILVSDKAERISDAQMRKTVNVGTSTNLAWANIQEVDGEGDPTGNYTHTATITGMLLGGVADIKLSGASEFFALDVEGNAVSFVDTNETVASGYTVKYQLEVPTTSNVNVGSVFANISDWGIEYLEASGEGAILWQYAQGIPDSVYGLLAKRGQDNGVISQVLAYLKSEIDSLNERLKNYGDIIKMAVVDSVDYKTCGKPMFLECSTAGAPNASRIPNDWDEDEYGVWTGVPLAPHSFYYDITSKKVYFAPRCTNSTADWILLN